MAFSVNSIVNELNLLPVGNYKAVVQEIKFKDATGAKKDIMISLRFTEGKYAGRTMMDTIYEGAFGFRLKPFLGAVGVDLNKTYTTAAELYAYVLGYAKDKEVMVEIGTRTYQEREFNEIKKYTAIPGSVTSVDAVIENLKVNPSLQPEKPTLEDVDTGDASASIDLDINVDADDLPF